MMYHLQVAPCHFGLASATHHGMTGLSEHALLKVKLAMWDNQTCHGVMRLRIDYCQTLVYHLESSTGTHLKLCLTFFLIDFMLRLK
jgi:hypothetical protein